MADTDNGGPEDGDRLAAPDLVRQVSQVGDAGLTIGRSMEQAFVARFLHVARALEMDGLAIVRLSADGWPVAAALTEFGRQVGRRLAAGHGA